MEQQHERLAHIRHSLSHLLAIAALEHDKEAQLGIGPVIDNGFYYDILFSTPLSEDVLPKLEKRMRELVKENLPFKRIEVSADQAREQFAKQPLKLELIAELESKNEPLSMYATGENFIDLCRGGHVEMTGEIPADAFCLSHIAGAYWRGDEKNQMLTRVYGLAFETKEALDAYKTQQEEAKKRDHRKLGKDLNLFVFSETVGKGLPIWTPAGSTIRRELERFIVDEEIRRGYQHVYTPDIAKIDLYKKSGHYPYYKDSMYAPIVIDDEEFMLRPMSCPHHFELYLSKPRSYRELPMRIAEMAKLYRYEQSGELSGLVRVRGFCLADAHIICADSVQAGAEIERALDLIEFIASDTFGLTFGKDYWYRLSLGDRTDSEKYYKDDTAWDAAEAELRTVLTRRNVPFTEAEAEAAFYGPKIDIQMRDVRGKENTAFTVQYDFVMPKRFNLTYTATDGSEKEAIVVHRSSVGAIERVMAFLIEHFNANFPLWLAPEQVRIIPITDAHHAYAQEVSTQLKDKGLRVELDDSKESMGKKIRAAKTERVPYFLVIGDAEVAAEQVTVEHGTAGKIGVMRVEDFVERATTEIKTRAKGV